MQGAAMASSGAWHAGDPRHVCSATCLLEHRGEGVADTALLAQPRDDALDERRRLVVELRGAPVPDDLVFQLTKGLGDAFEHSR
eukprot:6921888-Prymnesium_polylepis.1